MQPELISDQLFGPRGRVFRCSTGDWASFDLHFPPTATTVSLFVDVEGSTVPEQQREMFRQVVYWYPADREVASAIATVISNEHLSHVVPPDSEILSIFRLTVIDLRRSGRDAIRDWGWGFQYQFDRNAPEVYVTMTNDFHVKYCGLKD
jgi:hypothetical protein